MADGLRRDAGRMRHIRGDGRAGRHTFNFTFTFNIDFDVHIHIHVTW
jgi:hypothetical protein